MNRGPTSQPGKQNGRCPGTVAASKAHKAILRLKRGNM